MAWTRSAFLLQRFKELQGLYRQRERNKWLHKTDPMQFPNMSDVYTRNIEWLTPLFVTELINASDSDKLELRLHLASEKPKDIKAGQLDGIYRWDRHMGLIKKNE
jgi:hypothetical protein